MAHSHEFLPAALCEALPVSHLVDGSMNEVGDDVGPGLGQRRLTLVEHGRRARQLRHHGRRGAVLGAGLALARGQLLHRAVLKPEPTHQVVLAGQFGLGGDQAASRLLCQGQQVRLSVLQGGLTGDAAKKILGGPKLLRCHFVPVDTLQLERVQSEEQIGAPELELGDRVAHGLNGDGIQSAQTAQRVQLHIGVQIHAVEGEATERRKARAQPSQVARDVIKFHKFKHDLEHGGRHL